MKYRRGKNRHVGSLIYSHVISFEGEDEPDGCQEKPRKCPEICSSDAKMTESLSKLNTAAVRARKALEAHRTGDDKTAFEYLDLLFGGKFLSR